MRATFLHMADLHLGYRQYNSRERQNDFTRAYFNIIQTAIDRKVDFVVLSGDLFEKRAIDPLTLDHAITGLKQLKNAGIPCLAIEGNHELSYYRDSIGWVQFLSEQGLMTLLNQKPDYDRATYTPCEDNPGAYAEPLPGLRVYGIRYYGSATAYVVKKMSDALAKTDKQGIEYTILMAHTGIEGVLPYDSGVLSHADLSPLRPHIDYLALGHVHKPYEFDNWIYNPGSPETNSMTEAEWTDRGYYVVEVDTESKTKHRPVLHANPRRPFERIFFRVNDCNTPDELFRKCQRHVERLHHKFQEKEPVVELRLSGLLPFDRSALDLKALKTMLDEAYQPLVSFVHNDTKSEEFTTEEDDKLSRPVLERKIVSGLIERDNRFQAHSRKWTELALALKRMALGGTSAEAVLDELTKGQEQIRQEGEMPC